ncbi:hypothetical protein D3C86_2052240 [compost metagenome]
MAETWVMVEPLGNSRVIAASVGLATPRRDGVKVTPSESNTKRWLPTWAQMTTPKRHSVTK